MAKPRLTKKYLTPCAHCQRPVGPDTSTRGCKSGAGDLAICLYCGEASAFTDALTLRPLNADEETRVAEAPEGTILANVRNSVALSRREFERRRRLHDKVC